MSGRLRVRVPHSVWRMFQFDDGGVLEIYEAEPVRTTKAYAEYTMTTAGAAKLLHDVTNAAHGWLDGGTPLENANIVRSAAAYKRTLAKQLMTQLEAPAVITGAPDAPRRAETADERLVREAELTPLARKEPAFLDAARTLIARKAGKEHWCYVARRPDTHLLPTCTHPVITRGELYIEDVSETPAFQSGAHYCLACARLLYPEATAGLR